MKTWYILKMLYLDNLLNIYYVVIVAQKGLICILSQYDKKDNLNY